MSLNTHSLFYFGHTVTEDNFAIDFDEGSGELNADLTIGEYTLTEYAIEVERALNAAGGSLTYTVTLDRSTQKLTISATSNFSLLISSGSRTGQLAFEMMGFTGSDLSGDDSYEGDSISGSSYSTQFILQDYVKKEHFKKAVSATVNKSASGQIEVFKFGDESFYKMNFKYVTDHPQPVSSDLIRNNASGVDDLQTFMDYLITKAPVEFMPDEDTPATFDKIILESSSSDKDGTGYELKELYGMGLPGYFETGVLVMRVQT